MVETRAAESPKPRGKPRSQSRSPAGIRSRNVRSELSEAALTKSEDVKPNTALGTGRSGGNRCEGWFDEGEDPCEDVVSHKDPCSVLVGEELGEVPTPREFLRARHKAESTRSLSRSRNRSVSAWLSKRSPDSARAKSADNADESGRSESPRRRTPRTNPSVLCRVRPTNLEQSMKAFFASDYSADPQFTYTYSDEYVAKNFEENSKCCSELLPEAQRILERVQEQYGGPDAFMQGIYGGEKLTAEQLREVAEDYLKEHGIVHRVNIVVQDEMLCAASVLKPAFSDERYTLNLASQPTSCRMVQGICDHEIGTHLLRMINDELQVWHRERDRYKLVNPWVTEEGFATLNTYLSMPCKLLYPQALRYYACCRGTEVGFVDLFSELREHIPDPTRCWQLCCRIKRGLKDTSQPGAFCMDQAYFKGAVEILRHLEEVDFPRLYAGQLALQDVDKVCLLMRKEGVLLPKFINSVKKLEAYKEHCRQLICENSIESTVNYVSKPKYLSMGNEKAISPRRLNGIRKSTACPRRTRARSVPASSRSKGDKDAEGSGAAKTGRRSEPAPKTQEAEQPSSAAESKAAARDLPRRGRNAKSDRASQASQGNGFTRSSSSASLVVQPPSESRGSSSATRVSVQPANSSRKEAKADIPAKLGVSQTGESDCLGNTEAIIVQLMHCPLTQGTSDSRRTRSVSRTRTRRATPRAPPQGAPEEGEEQSFTQLGGSASSSPSRKLQHARSRGKLTKASYNRLTNAADAVCTAMGSFLTESLVSPEENSQDAAIEVTSHLPANSESADAARPAVDRKGLRCASACCSYLVNSDSDFGAYCCRKCYATGWSNRSHGNKCERIVAPKSAVMADASWAPRKSSTRARSRSSAVDKDQPPKQVGQCGTESLGAAVSLQEQLLDTDAQHRLEKCASTTKFDGDCSICCTPSPFCEELPDPSDAADNGSAVTSTAATAGTKSKAIETGAPASENADTAPRRGDTWAHSLKCEGIVAAEDLPAANPEWLPRKARRNSSASDADISDYAGLAGLRENWKCARPGCIYVIHRKAKYGGYCCDRCYTSR